MSQSIFCNKNGASPPRKPTIKVPKIDNTDLVARGRMLVLGRCLNLLVQNVDSFIYMMPQFWRIYGKALGLNLGNGRFQFEFSSEKDRDEVLRYGSTRFDKWMVAYARWKPLADANYPNTICLSTRITGIPFEYRVEEIYRLVGDSIGEVLAVDVAKGRVKIEHLCTKPLTVSSTLEFTEGNEFQLLIEYENLEGYCGLCYRMTHDDEHCYKAKKKLKVVEQDVKGKQNAGNRPLSYKGATTVGNKNVETSRDGSRGRAKGPLVSLRQGNTAILVHYAAKDKSLAKRSLQVDEGGPSQHVAEIPGTAMSASPPFVASVPTTMATSLSSKKLKRNLLSELDEERKLVSAQGETNDDDEEINVLESGIVTDEIMKDVVMDKAVCEKIVQEEDVHTFIANEQAEHEAFLKKYEEREVIDREMKSMKPPSGPSKPSSKSSTPIRVICSKKMNAIIAMSPSRMPKENKTKTKKNNEPNKGSMKF